MDPALFLLLLFLIGFLASFIGSFVGGANSLISVSSMLFVGVPPQLVVATHMGGAVGWGLGGIAPFAKSGKIVWPLVLPLSVLAMAGSMLGAKILVEADPDFLNRIAGFLVLMLLPMLAFDRKLGIERRAVSAMQKAAGFVLYFIIAVWAGFFAAGSGLFVHFIYMRCFGLTLLETKGTDKIPVTFLAFGAIAVLVAHGHFDWTYLLCSMLGQLAGSMAGAKYAIKAGDKRLKILMLIAVACMGVGLIFK